MSNIDTRAVREIFARLFVVAIENRINFAAFTTMLAKSEFVTKIERDQYDDCFNKTIDDILYQVTNNHLTICESYGVYNDAYWCGFSYFNLFQKTKKPFSYIFLKLPLARMMDLYPVFHEMDLSSLVDRFQKIEKTKTILRLLCEHYKCSVAKLSSATGINKATLAKYNASDDALYKGSFQNIIKIASFFDVPISLFVEQYHPLKYFFVCA